MKDSEVEEVNKSIKEDKVFLKEINQQLKEFEHKRKNPIKRKKPTRF